MSNKDSKVPILIVIVVAVILIAAGGYYILGGKITPGNTGEVNRTTPAPTAKETTIAGHETPGAAPAGTSAVVTAPARVETIKCELCHTEPQNLAPHVNGGKLCVTCHGSQVHNIHIGPGTVGLDCNTCHGSPPKIPVVDKSADGPGHYSVCENCHAAPPDSLSPSFGNLVTVHLSRAKYCTNCHGTDIGVIHAEKLANATK